MQTGNRAGQDKKDEKGKRRRKRDRKKGGKIARKNGIRISNQK